MTKKKYKTGKIAGFITKLIEILKNKENEDIIFYNEQERSFTIKNVRKFTEQILPKYFKHKNYSSFVRQVNLYDFHKIKHEGKQEAYKQEFFEINSTKQLKKIKRKPMGSQKIRQFKKQGNNSDQSENDGAQMEQDFIDSESDQKKSQQQGSQVKRQELNIQLGDLEIKKLFLQTQIRKEQQENERLETENIKLKSVFNSQNTQFYNQLLKILQSLMISQFNQGEIKRSTYDKIVRKIYEQKDKLNEVEKENHCIYDVLKRKGKMQKTKHFTESIFLTLVKELLTSRKDAIAIPQFIQTLLHFIENQQNSHMHNEMDAVPDPLFMNYDPYYISNQNKSRQQPKTVRKQSYEEKKDSFQKVKKPEYFHNESKESDNMRVMKEKAGNDLYQKAKLKKKCKKKDEDSNDEDYVPKNHR